MMSSAPDRNLVIKFVDAFEEVFDRDWDYTRAMLGMCDETAAQAAEAGLELIPIIDDNGTFVRPEVEDEIEDWRNRGRLLAAYRRLKRALEGFRLSRRRTALVKTRLASLCDPCGVACAT